MNDSTHRKVIEAIHSKWLDGKPFAVHEVRDASGVSTSSVRRTLDFLVEIRLVRHSTKASLRRNYRVMASWNDNITENIEAFELAKIMEMK